MIENRQDPSTAVSSRRASAPRRLVSRASRRLRWLSACCVIPLSACVTRPPVSDYARQASQALPAATATPLSASLRAAEAAHPGQTGFLLLTTGTQALRTRIALTRTATRRLDLQYYIADEDTTGKLMLGAVLRAAERGVRVRVLIDALNFKDENHLVATLDAQRNIEVRLFNLFSTADEIFSERTANVLTHLDQLTRRMHNKAMIADNVVAVTGGRNLGDQYFDASLDLLFRDLDVFAAGPITPFISHSFDRYWNSGQAYPLRALNRYRASPMRIAQVRANLHGRWERAAAPFKAEPVNATPLARQLARGELPLSWAKAEFVVDSPRKIDTPTDAYVSPPMTRVTELANAAKHEFLILSPYFVPHTAGVAMLSNLVKRGVHVAVLTNSLAATDAVAAQAGYSPYRADLLHAGVALYEFKPIQPRPAGMIGSKSRTALHTKAFVIDRQTLVVGSLNVDPHSAHLNTELALVIHSPTLAQQVAELFVQASSLDASYTLSLAPPGEMRQMKASGAPASPLVWTTKEDGHLAHYNFDPDAGLYRNLITGLFLMLPVQDQL